MLIITPGFGDLTPACQSRGSGLGHDCVPNKGRVDFPPVLKSGHTHRGRAGFFHPMSAVPGIFIKKGPGAGLSRPGPFAFDSGARVWSRHRIIYGRTALRFSALVSLRRCLEQDTTDPLIPLEMFFGERSAD
jgi:hypothetical protein